MFDAAAFISYVLAKFEDIYIYIYIYIYIKNGYIMLSNILYISYIINLGVFIISLRTRWFLPSLQFPLTI